LFDLYEELVEGLQNAIDKTGVAIKKTHSYKIIIYKLEQWSSRQAKE
jgi:hypothetical protein